MPLRAFPPKVPLDALLEDQTQNALDALQASNFTGVANLRTVLNNLRAARASQDLASLRTAAENLRDLLDAAPDNAATRRTKLHAAEIVRHIMETLAQ